MPRGQRTALRTLLGMGAAAALAEVNPEAAIVVAVLTALVSARRYARSGDPQDAAGLVRGVLRVGRGRAGRRGR